MLPLAAAAALGLGVPARPVSGRSCVTMRDRSLEGASSVLGRLAAEAFKRAQADPSKPIKTKSFVFKTKVTHTRYIAGAELVEYMNLPVESFALYDAELMRRIDADTFELRLPLRGSAGGLDLMQPKLLVRVTPSPETSSLLISSISASLFGDLQKLPEPGQDDEATAAAAAAAVPYSIDGGAGQQRPEAAAADAAGAAGAEAEAEAVAGGATAALARMPGPAYRDDDGAGSEARVLSGIEPTLTLTLSPNPNREPELKQVRVLSGIERGLRSASLSFNTTLAWRAGPSSRGAAGESNESAKGAVVQSTRLATTVSTTLLDTCCRDTLHAARPCRDGGGCG